MANITLTRLQPQARASWARQVLDKRLDRDVRLMRALRRLLGCRTQGSDERMRRRARRVAELIMKINANDRVIFGAYRSVKAEAAD